MSEKFSVKWEDFLRQKKKLDEDKTFQDEMDDLAAVQEALFLLVNTPKVSSSKEDRKVTLSEWNSIIDKIVIAKFFITLKTFCKPT